MTLLWLAACGSKLPTATLDVGGHAVSAELAVTYADRQLGLMHRDSMPAEHGMLFVYPNEEIRRFWMKDTRIPLSIAFANRHGEIVRIEDMTPFDTETTTSMLPATYALEMNQGWFEKNGVEKGAKITGIPADLKPE
ncbi:MAG: DUF192 domain-containing protein [Myxococcota bacterium]